MAERTSDGDRPRERRKVLVLVQRGRAVQDDALDSIGEAPGQRLRHERAERHAPHVVLLVAQRGQRLVHVRGHLQHVPCVEVGLTAEPLGARHARGELVLLRDRVNDAVVAQDRAAQLVQLGTEQMRPGVGRPALVDHDHVAVGAEALRQVDEAERRASGPAVDQHQRRGLGARRALEHDDRKLDGPAAGAAILRDGHVATAGRLQIVGRDLHAGQRLEVGASLDFRELRLGAAVLLAGPVLLASSVVSARLVVRAVGGTGPQAQGHAAASGQHPIIGRLTSLLLLAKSRVPRRDEFVSRPVR